MAVTKGLQEIKLAIVAAISFAVILMAVPLIGAGVEAEAAGLDEVESRLIIAWENGRQGLETLLDTIEQGPRFDDLLVRVPSIIEKLMEGRWSAPYIQSVELPGEIEIEEAIQKLSSLPGVLYVEPDTRVSVDSSCKNTYYTNQWYLPQIGADRAWEVEVGRDDVVVAVVDTGVDASHPDLAGRILSGYDFVDGDGSACDHNGHGTHVAGIIAASGEDGTGVTGLAWRIRILPVKVLDDGGRGYYSDVIEGIRYAADNGAGVINLSLGGGADSRALQEAVDYALSRGVAVAAAAGNDGLDSLSYPAACKGVIAVGATDSDDRPASFSNRGEGLDLMAPGVSIYSDYPGGSYAYMSGTSMAAPQVAGAMALLYSHYPGLSSGEAGKKLCSSALDLGQQGYDSCSGWGLLRVDKALGLEDEEREDELGDVEWYFAEGYTGPGFDTYILLENPAPEASSARLELFGREGPITSLNVEVAGKSRMTFHLNDMIAPGDVAAHVRLGEGSRVQAQRSIYFDYDGLRGGHTSRGCPASSEWYFAEGYTGPGFDTYLLVFNPGEEMARLEISWMEPGGVHEDVLDLPPLTRLTLKVDDRLPDREMAMAVTSDRPVVAERAMYFDSGGRQGGSVAAGSSEISGEWYFAEGYTGGEFDEWILLANPSGDEIQADIVFQHGDGMIVEREMALSPYSRATLHVDEVTGLDDAEVSATVVATEPGVVAERAMYFRYSGSMGEVEGGHVAGGSSQPDSCWLVPEGYTGGGFESWILVSNLEDRAVTVRVDIYGESGSCASGEYQVAPHSRFTIKENELLSGEGVSAELRAEDGARLVVEGAFYFNYRGGIDGGST
ncbi:MAG: DUF5719 family protein [Actinomycetota bacterium]|nr:DUF5719 family protein [Actinomycetota bacterium]